MLDREVEKKTSFLHQKSGTTMSGYDPLVKAIEKRLDNPFCDLPEELKDRITRAFAIPWDSLEPEQRLSVAEQLDFQQDPANQEELNYWFDYFNELAELDDRIAQLAALPSSTASEFVQQELHLEKLQLKRQQLEAQISKPVNETPAQRKLRLESWVRHETFRGWGALTRVAKREGITRQTLDGILNR